MFKEGGLALLARTEFSSSKSEDHEGRIVVLRESESEIPYANLASDDSVHIVVSVRDLEPVPKNFFVELPQEGRQDWSRKLQEAAFKAGLPFCWAGSEPSFLSDKFVQISHSIEVFGEDDTPTTSVKLTPEDALLVLQSRSKKESVETPNDQLDPSEFLCGWLTRQASEIGNHIELSTAPKTFPSFSYKWTDKKEFERVEKALLEYGYSWSNNHAREWSLHKREFRSYENGKLIENARDTPLKAEAEIYVLLGVEEPRDPEAIRSEAVEYQPGDWVVTSQDYSFQSSAVRVVGVGDTTVRVASDGREWNPVKSKLRYATPEEIRLSKKLSKEKPMSEETKTTIERRIAKGTFKVISWPVKRIATRIWKGAVTTFDLACVAGIAYGGYWAYWVFQSYELVAK